MLSKTRTSIITFAAAFSFAGASLVPTVAQAQVYKERDNKKICLEMKKEYDSDIKEGAKDSAAREKKDAKDFGCKWAGGTKYRESSEGSLSEAVRPGGEPPQNAPESGSPTPGIKAYSSPPPAK